MRRLDRDLRLLFGGILGYALGYGLYGQLLWVYALDLGASRFAVGALSAISMVAVAASLLPGAWAATHFRLRPVIIAFWWAAVPMPICFFLAPSWAWLIPGIVFYGMSMANNPALKAYIVLKSEPDEVAGNMTMVMAAYPIGLIATPTVGGLLANAYGMRTVFLIAAALFVVSSLTVSLISEEPYHAVNLDWNYASLRHNTLFKRYVAFFVVSFLAAYLGYAFLGPYMAQVHGQSYATIGLLASLTAVGAAVLGPSMGRLADRRGPRAGVAGVLAFLLAGAVLVLAGRSLAWWALAFLCWGSFDALRPVQSGIVGRSFGTVPLTWGFAIFETIMGIPMAGGSLLGGALYRTGYDLPFLATALLAAGLLAALALAGRTSRLQAPETIAGEPVATQGKDERWASSTR